MEAPDFSHALRVALHIVDMPIVPRVPPIQLLVQAIEPVCRRGHVCHLLAGHVVRNKLRDWVADEHVGMLDVVPQESPDIGLWRTLVGDEIAADLNVRAVEYRAVWRSFLDEWDEAGHLRVVDLLES